MAEHTADARARELIELIEQAFAGREEPILSAEIEANH
jgi:hypothetical protein